MLRLTGLESVPAGFGPSVVTIGKFNGVHVGHLAMIRRTRELAAERQALSVVLTFDRHPAALLHPESVPEDITGLNRRLELLEQAGIDATLILPFTQELAALSAREFVSRILSDGLSAVAIVVGQDFRFGFRAEGSVQTLRELGAEFGFEVIVIPDVTPEGTERVSSSLIRGLLESGDVSRANRLLGRVHAMRGLVVHGDARGRELGFPTANLSHEATGLIPADGVYAGWLIDQDAQRYPAAISIGTNPTFPGERHRRVEAFVIDETLDLYDHDVIVEFVECLRGMTAFDSIDALINQMSEDVVAARVVLASA